MYLFRRGSHWWIRKAVPVDLVAILGFAQVRRSLRTRDAALARRRALQLLIRVDDVYAVLRSEHPQRSTREVALTLLDIALSANMGLPDFVALKAELLTRAKHAILDFHPDDDDRLADPSVRSHSNNDDAVVTPEQALWLLHSERPRAPRNTTAVALLRAVQQMVGRDAVSVANGRRSVVASIRRELATSGALSDPASIASQYQGAIQDMREELVKISSTIASLNGGSPRSTPSQDAREIADAIAEQQRSRWSDELLSAAISRYESAILEDSNVGLKHKEDVKKRLLTFLTFVTDKPVRDISQEDLSSYKDHLDKLPDRSELRFKTHDVRMAIELNSKRAQPYPVIGSVTVNLKYLGPVRRLLGWLKSTGKIQHNPAEQIHSNKKEFETAKSKRFPMKPDQISRLFAETARSPVVSALYWLPPLMLFTGARINELAQLRTDDLRLYNGRLHLSVLCLEDEGNENDDKGRKRKQSDGNRSAKSPAAKRLIPVHNELLRMGFADFVSSRRKRRRVDCQMFDELKPNRFGHWSAAISKRINRQIRKLGITNEALSAYSLRHNFYDACKSSKIANDVRKKFMGHQLEGMDGVYGNPHPLEHESNEIDQLAFPDVDLTPYVSKRS